MKRIGFITGARSEYGVMKPVIRALVADSDFDVVIYATGMHYLQRYGYTINEIRKDNIARVVDVPCYEEGQPKKDDFVALLDAISKALNKDKPDIIYLIGDRLEAYAAALAAHFLKIPIAHYAGGQITEGAVDNIYRYNISNLASLHFVTNKYAVERLKMCPIIKQENIHFVGSSAVDAIEQYLQNPKDAICIDARLHRGNYVLVTFHSETMSEQNGNTIPEMLDVALQSVTSNGDYVLLTYPNNDDGAKEIIGVINHWESHPLVVVRQNLGASLYYVAVDNAKYVVGNSSSGIIEVPYFGKYTINVGNRQKGRNAPVSVIHIPNDVDALRYRLLQMDDLLKEFPTQEYSYGDGHCVEKVVDILRKYTNATL